MAISIAIAALFFIWLSLRWRCRSLIPLDGGLILAPMLILYFAPFIATNTDPRYRSPVDSLFIIESTFCLSMLYGRKRAPVLSAPAATAARLPMASAP